MPFKRKRQGGSIVLPAHSGPPWVEWICYILNIYFVYSLSISILTLCTLPSALLLQCFRRTTLTPPASTPPGIDAPGLVSVRDVTDTTALVTWFEPVAQVDAVRVSYGPSADPADRQVVELESSETQHHLGALHPDTLYQVALSAKKGDVLSVPVYETFLTGETVMMMMMMMMTMVMMEVVMEGVVLTRHHFIHPRG